MDLVKGAKVSLLPKLHLLKVNYPMNDESTLRDAGCFFLWIACKKNRNIEDMSLCGMIYFEEVEAD